jgi:hypothetical protein
MWKARNNILHGGDNKIDEHPHSQMLEHLLEYSRERFSTLWACACDHFIIAHPVSDVIKWSRDRMKSKLEVIDDDVMPDSRTEPVLKLGPQSINRIQQNQFSNWCPSLRTFHELIFLIMLMGLLC